MEEEEWQGKIIKLKSSVYTNCGTDDKQKAGNSKRMDWTIFFLKYFGISLVSRCTLPTPNMLPLISHKGILTQPNQKKVMGNYIVARKKNNESMTCEVSQLPEGIHGLVVQHTQDLTQQT